MKQNNLVIPVITYSNTERDKSIIYKENKNKSGIYRWTNLVTGESYVGSSLSLTKRFRDYYKKETKRLVIYNAIHKHGHHNFSLDILEYCSPDIAIKREQHYINLLKPEYNILKWLVHLLDINILKKQRNY
jgi:group I intron endonuclease